VSGPGYVVADPGDRPGIGSRLLGLAQAVWLARELGRRVVVDWRRTPFLEDQSKNYFTEFFEPVRTICGVSIEYAPSRDAKKYTQAGDAEKWSLRFDDSAELARDPDAAPPYVVVRSLVDLEPFAAYDEAGYGTFLEDVYRRIVPRPAVAREVEEWHHANLRGHFVVGVNVSTGNGLFEQGGRYAGRLDVGIFEDRRRFLSLIEEGRRRAIRTLPGYMRRASKVFVATDSGDMSELLCKLDGAVARRTVFPPPGTGHGFSGWSELGYSHERAAADVIVDMLLLAQCDALIKNRTRFSSYALVSARYFSGNVQEIEALNDELAAGS
jgi:hypothetical protein